MSDVGGRPQVEWVRPRGPVAVAAGTSALVLAALGAWVLAGALPGLVADVLLVLAVLILIRERASFTDPEDCTGAGVSVLGFAWATAVACGLVVSVQRSTWAWGAPVSWWVHVLVGLGILALTGAVSWACVLACFLVGEDAAFLGAGWGVLVGVVVGFSTLAFSGVVIWVGMGCGAAAALVAAPLLTVFVRVRVVPVPTDWDARLR
ncbi:MAG: hypothetical protein JOY78_13110 [Pseudonocardia sp.]|nr:hypothetical protein [Pseudonocardia sp.]